MTYRLSVEVVQFHARQTFGRKQITSKSAPTRLDQLLYLSCGEAAGLVAVGGYRLMPVGRFSDKVMNLEDMLFVALVDGEFAGAEREEIQGFIDKIQVTEEQVEIILTESKMKLDIQMAVSECGKCGTTLPPDTKDCPVCNPPSEPPVLEIQIED